MKGEAVGRFNPVTSGKGKAGELPVSKDDTRLNGGELEVVFDGFAVVAVDYPLTSMRAPGGPMLEDVVNQPADISFIIDSLLQRNADPKDRLYGRIDPERIGATGISLGGMTTLMAAYHPRWHDKRIAAAISLAGPSEMFAPVFFQQRQLPFMMVAASEDAIVGFAKNAQPIPELIEGA